MAQHPRNVVLLDLDGTLTKSDGGIIASVIKTFEELGRPVPDDAASADAPRRLDSRSRVSQHHVNLMPSQTDWA